MTSSAVQSRKRTWWGHLAWVLGAGVLGIAVTAVFAGLLHLPRDLFVGCYTVTAGAFLAVYSRWAGIDLRRHLVHRWRWGAVGAVLSGALVVANVFSQPASPAPQGTALLFALFWLGLVYGIVDALLLSVLPVVATWQAFAALGRTDRWPGRLGTGVIAFVASLLVTAAYHWGYPEFRSAAVVAPVVGNGILTLAYLLSGSPLAAIGGHVMMHVAAVLHAPATTLQLPPHH
jgi:hypothetical protein